MRKLTIKNLIQRTLTGIVFVIVIVAAISIHPLLFGGVFTLFVGLLIHELYALIKDEGPLWVRWLGIAAGMYLFTASCLFSGGYTGSVIYLPYLLVLLILFVSGLYTHTANPVRQWGNMLFAQCYCAGALSFLCFISYLHAPIYDPWPVLMIFIVIWLYDTGAFLIGIWLGKHRLFERISPLKSWEGFFGGFAVVMVASVTFAHYFPALSIMQWLIFGVLIVVSATFGDLMESLLKRTCRVKDSGDILPGHGGVLDRFDSVLLSAPAVYIFFEWVTRS